MGVGGVICLVGCDWFMVVFGVYCGEIVVIEFIRSVVKYNMCIGKVNDLVCKVLCVF